MRNNVKTVAANIYTKLEDPVYDHAMEHSSEPFRAVIDIARLQGLHTIKDGSKRYAALVDCLEDILCSE